MPSAMAVMRSINVVAYRCVMDLSKSTSASVGGAPSKNHGTRRGTMEAVR